MTFICSDHRSLSITLSKYSCTRSHQPRQSQAPALMSKATRSQTCFNLQSGVHQVFQLPAHLPVLVQFPHLQEVRAAPDRRSLWCGSHRPRLQGQTPAHVGAERRSQSPLLQRRDWRQCLSAWPWLEEHQRHRGPLYLCSREVLPAAVPQVGRGDVWALFPQQPLSPSTLVTRFLDGDSDLVWNECRSAGVIPSAS